MKKLSSFTFITLDGFYKGVNEDINWHQHGGEEIEYSEESLKSGDTLLFGRITYKMMGSFWQSPMAFDSFPKVAEGMNKADKIVLSKTLKSAHWKNSKLLKGNLIDEIRQLKETNQNDITVLGSGSLVKQLAEARLIDEYQIMIDPVAIGTGTSLFSGLKNQLNFKLVKKRVFDSGVILIYYKT